MKIVVLINNLARTKHSTALLKTNAVLASDWLFINIITYPIDFVIATNFIDPCCMLGSPRWQGFIP